MDFSEWRRDTAALIKATVHDLQHFGYTDRSQFEEQRWEHFMAAFISGRDHIAAELAAVPADQQSQAIRCVIQEFLGLCLTIDEAAAEELRSML